jgi:Arc/MetJ-type ribon-helix-helix transcriptional regulator
MDDEMMTINISMPKGMYADAKKKVATRHYASISELIRDGVRGILYPNLTVNGFTPEFEEEVLRRSGEPSDNDIEWDGKESDLIKYVEGQKASRLRKRSKGLIKKVSRVEGSDKFAGGAVQEEF